MKEFPFLQQNWPCVTVSARRTTPDHYGVPVALPGFNLIGLRGWDDFLVRDENGNIFSVPSVPLDKSHLAPFRCPPAE
jgi:hypothetical protein